MTIFTRPMHPTVTVVNPYNWKYLPEVMFLVLALVYNVFMYVGVRVRKCFIF